MYLTCTLDHHSIGLDAPKGSGRSLALVRTAGVRQPKFRLLCLRVAIREVIWMLHLVMLRSWLVRGVRLFRLLRNRFNIPMV